MIELHTAFDRATEPADSAPALQGQAWNPGPEPNVLVRGLIKLSGVDYPLARTMPTNEQRTMAFVGGALVFGALFQAICCYVALRVISGEPTDLVPAVFIIAIISGILFIYDAKYVAGDWVTQGLGVCRARGILERGDWTDKVKRPAATMIRCGVSLALASFMTWFVLLVVFNDDVERQLAKDNRRQNAALVAGVEAKYGEIIADITRQIEKRDAAIANLIRERAELLGKTIQVEPDRQISVLVGQIDEMRAAKAEAERLAARNEVDANAEHRGIPLRSDFSGKKGRGQRYHFYDDEAHRQRAIAVARTAEIETNTRSLEVLRRQYVASVDDATTALRARIESVERQLATEKQARSMQAAERRALEDGRNTWIGRQVRQAPDFIALPTGLSDRLKALWALVASSELVLTLALSLKAIIMLLESAGPVAKTLFAAPGIYGMRAAVRIEDAADAEVERREAQLFDAAARRLRRLDGADDQRAARRQREARGQAGNAPNRTIMKSAVGGD